jgi:hypothetical protein
MGYPVLLAWRIDCWKSGSACDQLENGIGTGRSLPFVTAGNGNRSVNTPSLYPLQFPDPSLSVTSAVSESGTSKSLALTTSQQLC